jgi:hypothetical protein
MQMNDKATNIISLEGLTYERIYSLINTEIAYKALLENLKEKEELLREKYKKGTFDFVYSDNGIYSARYRKHNLTKDEAINRLGEELKDSKEANQKQNNYINELEEEIKKIKFPEKQIRSLKGEMETLKDDIKYELENYMDIKKDYEILQETIAFSKTEILDALNKL